MVFVGKNKVILGSDVRLVRVFQGRNPIPLPVNISRQPQPSTSARKHVSSKHVNMDIKQQACKQQVCKQ